jgi:two-component system response regulator QseB
LVHDNIILDTTSRNLKINGEAHILSAKEYSILYALIKNPSAVISRSELEDQIYGWNEEIGSNAIEVHIHQIRHKFGKSIIQNIRGLGYRIGCIQ